MTWADRGNGMALKWIGAVLAILVLGACGSTGRSGTGPRSDLQRTWDEAYTVLPDGPGRYRAGTMAEILASPPSGSLPTIIHMHGCTGIGSADIDFARHLARNGFAVIVPDSMARSWRPLQCDPWTQTGGYNLFVYDFRQAEIAYALEEIKDLGWVDRRNLFLIGASEGGVAAALYRGDEFRARVIAQWTCNGATLVAGIDAPSWTPVLSVVRMSDPWYASSRTQGQSGDCGAFMGDRPGSRSIVLPGSASHDVLGDDGVRAQILRFLGANRVR